MGKLCSLSGVLGIGLVATLGGVIVAQPAAQAQVYHAEVVMSGLLNPRGLAVDPLTGGIFVAEAGEGGDGASIPGGEGEVSFGATGGVSRFLNGVQSRVFNGLPSLAGADGANAVGLHDIVFNASGQAFGVIGLGADPAQRQVLTNGGAPGGDFGQLVQLNLDGTNTKTNLADLAGFEATEDPDGVGADSNPYGLVALMGGGFAVVDAGGNSLLGVDTANTITEITTFANKPNNLPFGPPTVQSVPTSVTEDTNGDLLVGELTGGPFPPGNADIYRVVGGVPTALPEGSFTMLIDVAFGPDGFLYALELSSTSLAFGPGPGTLSRVNPVTGERQTLLSSPLFFPGGVAFAPDGTIYVSNRGTSPGGGQVLRLIIAPEPATGGLVAFGLASGLGVFSLRLARRRK